MTIVGRDAASDSCSHGALFRVAVPRLDRARRLQALGTANGPGSGSARGDASARPGLQSPIFHLPSSIFDFLGA